MFAYEKETRERKQNVPKHLMSVQTMQCEELEVSSITSKNQAGDLAKEDAEWETNGRVAHRS